MTHDQFIKLAREFGATDEKTWWHTPIFWKRKLKYSSCIFKLVDKPSILLRVTYSSRGVYCVNVSGGNQDIPYESIEHVQLIKNLYGRVIKFMGRVMNAK